MTILLGFSIFAITVLLRNYILRRREINALIEIINKLDPNDAVCTFFEDNDIHPVMFNYPELFLVLNRPKKRIFTSGVEIKIKSLNDKWQAYLRKYFLV